MLATMFEAGPILRLWMMTGRLPTSMLLKTLPSNSLLHSLALRPSLNFMSTKYQFILAVMTIL